MIQLLLVAVSVGLSNFAASIGLSVSGVDRALRVRVILLFGLFEGGMPIVGLLIGHDAAGALGGASRWIGGALLVATGLYGALASRPAGAGTPGTARLAATALALSIDNLVVGFALGTLAVPLAEAATAMAVVSVLLSLVGLEIGARLGRRAGDWSEEIGGAVLVGVGALVLGGVIS